jgi:hypothetical protein
LEGIIYTARGNPSMTFETEKGRKISRVVASLPIEVAEKILTLTPLELALRISGLTREEYRHKYGMVAVPPKARKGKA